MYPVSTSPRRCGGTAPPVTGEDELLPQRAAAREAELRAEIAGVGLNDNQGPDSVSFLPLLKDAAVESPRSSLVLQSTRCFVGGNKLPPPGSAREAEAEARVARAAERGAMLHFGPTVASKAIAKKATSDADLLRLMPALSKPKQKKPQAAAPSAGPGELRQGCWAAGWTTTTTRPRT